MGILFNFCYYHPQMHSNLIQIFVFIIVPVILMRDAKIGMTTVVKTGTKDYSFLQLKDTKTQTPTLL